jgi:hypothetical protein
MEKFSLDSNGNTGSDEYRMASELKEAVDARDFKKMELLSKKPLFSFIETEITK